MMMSSFTRAIAAIALASPLAAIAMNLGPYRIGMSNADAKRIGMYQCKESSWQVECRGALQVLGESRDVKLTFDVKSKRLVDASLSVVGPSWKSETARDILAELKASECKSNLEEVEIFSVACYGRPNQVRRVVWSSNRYLVSVRGNDGQAAAWFQKQKATSDRKQRESAFEQGK